LNGVDRLWGRVLAVQRTIGLCADTGSYTEDVAGLRNVHTRRPPYRGRPLAHPAVSGQSRTVSVRLTIANAIMLKRAASVTLLNTLFFSALFLGSAAHAADRDDTRWSKTLERIATGVVSIQIDQARAFDTEWNSSGQATGFVVDAKRGLILTNRHVVTPGPVTAQAVFQNREEVELQPVYRDPVHDFGFYRYDPSKLRFIKPAELPLYPQGAQVGREIRVVGNDAGEQLSILAGTLARLDRQAPEYGVGKYNDFNTFYFQAASGTSGGSSGSPVIDIEGRVLALNAGGATSAASSFYLPLGRIVRALKLMQDDKPVMRGTLQTVFGYTPFDELKRLGLRAETETQVRKRFPGLTGMLVVSDVQPGSAAENVLEPGDVLLKIDGELVTTFEPLEQLLDDKVGASIKLELERGGQPMTHTLNVQDLEEITPASFLQVGDAVVHTLSWQQARHLNVPVRGVYVANPGYVFGSSGVARGAVIVELNGTATPSLADFERAIAQLKDGERGTLRFFTMDDPRAPQLRIFRMDRRWFPAAHCVRDDRIGTWPCKFWPEDGVAEPPKPASTTFVRSNDPIVNKLSPSLVLVNFDMPYPVSGITERNYYGTGLIVDSARGFVLVDRNTVPVPLGDVRITFAGTVEIPGRVLYIHPQHNLAVVSYDPALIGDTPVRAAALRARNVAPGEQVWVVGKGGDGRIQSQSAIVSSVEAFTLPLSRTLQFRESNLETISLVNGPSDFDGVLADAQGNVLATWSSFAFESGRETQQTNRGIPAEVVLDMLPRVGSSQRLQSLEAELAPVSLAGARKLGLSEEWVKRLEAHNPERRQVLGVLRTVAGSPASSLLRSGDLVLAIDGKTVNRFREVELAVQKPTVRVTLWREKRELSLDVETAALDGRDLDRIVVWAGAVLQAPHRAMAAQRGIPREGVFVAYFGYGSPATRYKLWAGRRILEVDGQATPDLDAFIKAVSGREDRASVRLKTITWNDSVEVITLKLDKRYWPFYELKRTNDGWKRAALE
jgi:S1-C subfamily serine protease